MTPFWQGDTVTLYHADAIDVVGQLPEQSIDLLVADPVYGKEWRSNRRAAQFDTLFGDTPAGRKEVHEVLRVSLRALRAHRHLYVFGPGDVLDGLKVADVVELVWDKTTMGSGDLTSPWGPAHERINFTVNKHRHGGKAGLSVLPTRLRKGTVLAYPRITGRNVRHPSEKPVPLMRELLESSSRQGEVVLDPFAGSGSTGVAAILAGRHAILVEIDERWCELAAGRLAAAERVMASARGL